ncbi:MAG: TonB-dependent receptor [Woeseia sp.]
MIRGHEARSDVFVDGVRDPGMTTRESFATEQIEITKGPSSTFAGRGSTGGAVNGITKQASPDYNFSILEGALGTDNHHRVTFDTNKTMSDQVAFRANFLHAAEDVPDRSPAEKKRAGALLSGLYAPTEKLGFVADFYYLQADDVPDLGSYFDQTLRAPLKDVPVYLQTDSDFLDTEVKTITLKTNYSFNDGLRLQNSTRYGQTDNGYVTTGMRGTTRHETDPVAPGVSTLSLSSHQGWQQVEYFVNQLNVLWDTSTGDLKHTFVMGLELTDETVTNGVFALENTGATNCVLAGRGATAPPQDSYCALDGNGNAVQNLGTLLGRTVTRGDADSDFKVNTYSMYLMDTVELSDNWSGFFGVRYDHFDYNNLVNSRGTLQQYDYSDGFWNGHIGVVRTIGDNGNVYATYSSSTNINGGESDVGGSCGYGGLCGTPDQVEVGDPETTINMELGTKWNLFNERLLLTAAAFRMTKDDVMESVGDAYSTIGTLNTGKNRVQGVEFSVTGSITDKLSAQFSAAFMESEVLESFNTDDIGRVLSNFADDSLYLQVRYDANEKVSFGGSVTYKSEMYGGQPDTAAGYNSTLNDYSIVVPSYDVVDLFVNYYYSDRVNLRLNASNVSDEEYWVAAYRSGSFMYLGDSRNVRATVTWGF